MIIFRVTISLAIIFGTIIAVFLWVIGFEQPIPRHNKENMPNIKAISPKTIRGFPLSSEIPYITTNISAKLPKAADDKYANSLPE